MLSKKELIVLSHLRKDSRQTLTKISKSTGVPISTIFEKLKKYKKDIILKNTSLIDFNKIGYGVIIKSFIRAQPENKQEILNHLITSPNVNNLSSLSNKYDFIIEGVFRNLKELRAFSDSLKKFNIEKEDFYVIESIKKESFLSYPNVV
jgi:DNA-binding Lrp family transcriptional regulator